MKKIILPIFISLLFFACQQEPPSEITGQTGTDSLPNNSADTGTWHKSNPGIGRIGNFYFLTPSKGFCTSDKGVFRTADSGKTWSVIDTSTGIDGDVFFLDLQYGYFVKGKNFGVTIDGGTTWDIKQPDTLDATYGRVFFLTHSIGFITSSKGLYKTSDMGITWNLLYSKTCLAVYFINEQKGWIGASRSLYNSTDGGVSFNRELPEGIDATVYSIMFTDSLHGWANGRVIQVPGNDYVFRTSDGGNTWDKIKVSGSIDIQFLNNNVGYIPTGDGISKSMDGGSTWEQILKVDGTGLQEVFFVDENNGWAGDKDGNIYHWSK